MTFIPNVSSKVQKVEVNVRFIWLPVTVTSWETSDDPSRWRWKSVNTTEYYKKTWVKRLCFRFNIAFKVTDVNNTEYDLKQTLCCNCLDINHSTQMLKNNIFDL